MKELSKTLAFYFVIGIVIMTGFRVVDWLIPAKPVEVQHSVCIKDSSGDYKCEVYEL